MTNDELKEILRQLHLNIDSEPQLIYVFYQTADGLVNNFSINMRRARQRNRRPMTNSQLVDLMESQYPDARDSRLLAVERPAGLTRWLDTADVCQMLHVTRQTINRWARRGLLHPAKMGHRHYFDATEIDAVLRSNIIQENGRLDKKGM